MIHKDLCPNKTRPKTGPPPARHPNPNPSFSPPGDNPQPRPARLSIRLLAERETPDSAPGFVRAPTPRKKILTRPKRRLTAAPSGINYWTARSSMTSLWAFDPGWRTMDGGLLLKDVQQETTSHL